jgi:pimeloyl-ACP methyl ester carboxylesterase
VLDCHVNLLAADLTRPAGQRISVHKHNDIDRLTVTSGGSGDPILFIHGFGFSKFTWRHVCQELQDSFTYYAIDLPGSGSSPARHDFECSLENLSDVVADFIIRKDLTSLTLAGSSLGGGLALLSLLRHSAELSPRIKSLCIVDGIAYPQKFPFFVGLLRIPILGRALLDVLPPDWHATAVLRYCYFDRSLITNEQIQEYGGHLRKKEVRKCLVQTARSIDTARLSEYIDRLNTIEIPSLLIWGREDRVVPLQIGQRLARELKRSRLKIIEQCGHIPHEERPSEVSAAIKQFGTAADRG